MTRQTSGRPRAHLAVAAAALIAATVAISGCSRKSCLRGDCEELRACDDLAYECADPGTLYVGPLAGAPAEVRLRRGDGADADLVLSNGVTTVVIDAIDAPHDLAPTGGNIIDLGQAGGADDLNLVYQIAGILPDDAFAYDRLDVVDHAPDYVAVIARGHLDGRPEVEVLTRYELRPCDPGVRVRSELFNGSPDVQAWVVADVPHWGKRSVLPFAAAPGEGYVAPELDLLELGNLYEVFAYGAGAATAVDSPGYGVAACDAKELEGINDLELSALGTARQLVRPGETVVLERVWLAAGAGQGPGPAIDGALAVREQLLGDATPLGVTGHVVADGLDFGGDARRASVIISAAGTGGAAATPLNAVVPGADGRFTAGVPVHPRLTWELWSFGRVVASGTVPDDGALGDIDVPAPGTLELAVADDGGAPLYAAVVLEPADDATFAAVRGTFHGRWDECAPWLGPPHGGSPACNRVLVDPAGATVEVPAGTYDVYATAGPDHTLARQAGVTITGGETTTLAFTLSALDVVPAGWLTADLHVHGRASFDSSIPDPDRVRSFVAAGVQVIAATDHDFVRDYAETVADLGVGDRVRVMGGVETTQLIPWLDIPDEDLPRVIGHFNFWPIVPVPGQPRGGAPWDELVEPGSLFDRMAPLVGPDGLMMLNHPWDEPQSGRDLGYLRAIEFDPRRPIPDTVDGSRNGALLRVPGGGHRNIDWNVIEVQNGAGVDELVKTRPLWWSLISQGFVTAGVANSDSHGLTDASLGWGRTLVETGGDLAGFDVDGFDRAVRDGKTTGGSGVVVLIEVGPAAGPRRGPGLTPYRPSAGDVVAIEVRAAPWIPVDEVRVVTSTGVRVIASGNDLLHPADPFGAADVVRWQAQVPLADLVGGGDDWFVVEAGLPLPTYLDLDDDGVPDTGDNDGDGVVTVDDIEDPDDDSGPLRNPPDPARDATDDPRYLMTRVVPGAFPIGFTSPILIDGDGGGWAPPGVSP